MTDKYDKSAVPQEAINEFVACDAARRNSNIHFLSGFRMAAEAVAKNAGVTSLDSLPPKDRKTVFSVVVDVARTQVKMPKFTFDRYCKIARYCLIYNISWDVAENANRKDLRWCKKRIIDFRTGTYEEKMQRAWKDRQILNNEAKKEKERKERELLNSINDGNDDEDDDEAKKKTLLYFPDPADFENEDEYWKAYLISQVKHIQKYQEKLKGGGEIKTVVLDFLGRAKLVLKKKTKPTPVMASVARNTN